MITDMTESLPKCFKQWIKTLKPQTEKNVVCDAVINPDATFIDMA